MPTLIDAEEKKKKIHFSQRGCMRCMVIRNEATSFSKPRLMTSDGQSSSSPSHFPTYSIQRIHRPISLYMAVLHGCVYTAAGALKNRIGL